jgi:hypothetical protein
MSDIVDPRPTVKPHLPEQGPAEDRDARQAEAYRDLESSINDILCMAELCWDACFNALARSIDDRANAGLFALGHLKEMLEQFEKSYEARY